MFRIYTGSFLCFLGAGQQNLLCGLHRSLLRPGPTLELFTGILPFRHWLLVIAYGLRLENKEIWEICYVVYKSSHCISSCRVAGAGQNHERRLWMHLYQRSNRNLPGQMTTEFPPKLTLLSVLTPRRPFVFELCLLERSSGRGSASGCQPWAATTWNWVASSFLLSCPRTPRIQERRKTTRPWRLCEASPTNQE